MRRADRVLDLEELLRADGATTVSRLARILDVDPRTVRRDLALLRERGLPLTTQSGPGGGVRLDPRRASMSLSLRLDEVVGLWLGATVAGAAAALPWTAAARRGLRKLLAGLAPERARAMRALAQRVFVGPAATAAMRAGARPPSSEVLRVAEDALIRRRGLRFAYVDRGGARSHRTVEPHGLLVQPPLWYLLAADRDKRAARMFRMDRITRASVDEAIGFQPDGGVITALRPTDAALAWRPLEVA